MLYRAPMSLLDEVTRGDRPACEQLQQEDEDESG